MPEIWSERGLVQEFKRLDKSMESRRFCFILGAGASVTSGIPAGGRLVHRWLKRLMERDPRGGEILEAWATEERLGIPGFDLNRAAEFYPQIFERCFDGDRHAGYQDLEDLMKDKDPSVGYSFLAQILSNTRHQVVITTNFDNLVGDALAIYSDKHPLICGHESLAHFAQPDVNRPLVAKIHRDLFLSPKNDSEGVSTLAPGWADSLRVIFSRYTPIFVGYGGNDGSLMDFLNALPPGHIQGRPFWCYLERFGDPSDGVKATIDHLGGVMVPILGFDELMLKFADALGYGFQDAHIMAVAERRKRAYQAQLVQLTESIEAAESASNRPASDLGPRGKRHTESETDPDRLRSRSEPAAPPPPAKAPGRPGPPKAPPKRQASRPTQDRLALDSMLSWTARGPETEELEAEKLGANEIEAEDAAQLDALEATGDNPVGEAQEALSRMIERSPGWMQVRENAERAIKAGDYTQAMEIYQEGLEEFPQEAYLKVKLAELLETHLGNPERAKGLYRMVGEDDGAEAYELQRAALGLERLGVRIDITLEIWKRALEAASHGEDLYGEVLAGLSHFMMDISAPNSEVETLLYGHYQSSLPARNRTLRDDEVIAQARYQHLTGNLSLARGYLSGFQHLPTLVYLGHLRFGLIMAFLDIALRLDHAAGVISGLKRHIALRAKISHPRDLSRDAQVAIKAGHPNPDLLRTLAEVIARREDISALDEFEEWRNA